MTPRISQTIRVAVDAFRDWHRQADMTTREREKVRRQNTILRLPGITDDERTFVMDACERAPVKATPGRDPNPEIQPWAEKVFALVPAHGGRVREAARACDDLWRHINTSIADQEEAKGFFESVCKRAHVLKHNAETQLTAGTS